MNFIPITSSKPQFSSLFHSLVIFFSFLTACDRPQNAEDITILRQQIQAGEERQRVLEQQLATAIQRAQVAEQVVAQYKKQTELPPAQVLNKEPISTKSEVMIKPSPPTTEDTSTLKAQINVLQQALAQAQNSQKEITDRNQVLEKENKDQLALLEATQIACPIPGKNGVRGKKPNMISTKKSPVPLIAKIQPKEVHVKIPPSEPVLPQKPNPEKEPPAVTSSERVENPPILVEKELKPKQPELIEKPVTPTEVVKDPPDPNKLKKMKKLNEEQELLVKSCNTQKQEATELFTAKIERIRLNYLKLLADRTNDPKQVCPTCQLPKSQPAKSGKVRELWNRLTKKQESKTCPLQNPSACAGESISKPSPSSEDIVRKRDESAEKVNLALKKEEQLLQDELKITLGKISKECLTRKRSIQKQIEKLNTPS